MTDLNAGQPANVAPAPAVPTSESSNTSVATPAAQTTLPENNAPSGSTQPTETPAAPTLSEKSVNYLKSQNIDLATLGIDASNQAVVDAYIAGHKSMRNANNTANAHNTNTTATYNDIIGKTEPQAQVQQVVAPELSSTQNQTPATPDTTTTNNPAVARTISEIDIVNMKNYLDSQFKDIDSSKLGTKDFYKEMREFGLSPVTQTGDWNVSAINRYAEVVAQRERISQLENDIKNRPTQTIPNTSDVIDRIDETAQRVDQLTVQSAESIVLTSNRARRAGGGIHPQYQQAVDFLQNYYSK